MADQQKSDSEPLPEDPKKEAEAAGPAEEQTQFPPFAQFVKERLGEIVAEGGGARVVAKAFDIPYPSLMRYLKDGCKIDSVNAQLLLGKLAKDPYELQAIYIHYFPKEARIWKSVYSLDKYHTNKPLELLNLIEADRLYMYLESMAGFGHGYPVTLVEATWGQRGLDALQQLQDIGVLTVKDERVYRPYIDGSYGRLPTLKRVISYLVSDYTSAVDKNDYGALFNSIMAVNGEGRQALRKAYLDFVQKVYKITESPETQGNIPVFVSMISGEMFYSKRYQEFTEPFMTEADGQASEEAGSS